MSFAKARIKEWRTEGGIVSDIDVSFAQAEVKELSVAKTSNQQRPAVTGDVSEEDIERQLAEEGLIRLPQSSHSPAGAFKRINVGGKPISEMIIEERR